MPEKKRSVAPHETNVRGKRRVRKPVNSCAKKCTTFVKANTAHVRQNRRSQSDFRRPVARASNCRRQSEVRRRPSRAPGPQFARPVVERVRLRPVHAPSVARSAAKGDPRRRARHSLVRRKEPPDSDPLRPAAPLLVARLAPRVHVPDRPRRVKPHARASVVRRLEPTRLR